MTSRNLVLRTVYIDPAIDDALRNEAFVGRTSKNDLFRKYLALGIKTAQEQAAEVARHTESTAPEVGKKASRSAGSKRAVPAADPRPRRKAAAKR